MNESLKPCVACCELIAAKAKVCPRCHQRQDRLIQFFSSAAGGALVLAAVAGGFFYMASREPPRFSEHASALTLRSEVVHAESEADGTVYASCVGEISNASAFGWRDVTVEARYFNSQGELVDAATDKQDGVYIPANGTAAVRVLDRAARSPSSYASCKLSLKNAVSR